MTFNDIFKNSFLNLWTAADVSLQMIVYVLLIASMLAIYIFFVYRHTSKRTFYSKNFNISLAGVTVITSAIILTIQSNIVLSLGMVGALSIVRFRTAIKDPMDLMFLFWAISTGIICGAKMPELAIILSFILTLGIVIFDKIPMSKESMILVVNSNNIDKEDKIIEEIEKYTNSYVVKSRNISASNIDMTIELRTSDAKGLIKAVSDLDCTEGVSLISHDGEVTF